MDAEAEAPILWPPADSLEKILMLARLKARLKARGEGMTENERVGWHHQLVGHEFEQAPGVGVGQ